MLWMSELSLDIYRTRFDTLEALEAWVIDASTIRVRWRVGYLSEYWTNYWVEGIGVPFIGKFYPNPPIWSKEYIVDMPRTTDFWVWKERFIRGVSEKKDLDGALYKEALYALSQRTTTPMPAYLLSLDITPKTVVAGDRLLFTGRLQEDGVAIPNVEVEIWFFGPPPSPQEWQWSGINFYTDDAGEFIEDVGTTGLLAGTYRYKARYFY